MDETPVLLFDGVCNLCVGSVQFFLKRDKKGLLSFASLQSEYGKTQKQKYQIDAKIDSLILVDNNQVFYFSTAALKAATKLGGMWKITSIFLFIPVFIRDGIYKWIAKHRYKFFGKKESCWIPTPELSKRFLD